MTPFPTYVQGVLFAHHRLVLDRAHAALLAGGFLVDRLDGETPTIVRPNQPNAPIQIVQFEFERF